MGEASTVRLAFIATIGFSLLITVFILLQALLLSRIIANAFLQGATLAELSPSLWLLLGVVVLRAAASGAKSRTAATLAIQVKADLRERLVEHIAELGPSFTKGERSGELVLAATEGIEALDAFFRDYLPAMVVAVGVPLIILAVVLPLDTLTFIILLVTAPLVPLFMILIGKAAGALAREQYGTLSRMSAHFLDAMQGLPTLKLFNRSRQQIATIHRITDQFRQTTMRVLRLAFLSAFVLEFIATLSVAIVAVEIGLRLLFGGVGFQQALFLLIIAPEFYLPLRELGAKFHAGQDGTAAADRIFAVLEHTAPERTGSAPPPQRMHITFEGVHHAYGDRQALRGLSMELHPGEAVALVGQSGSGKTTTAHLLLRFITPTGGKITVDGTDLTTIDPDAWRQQVAWVPQRPYLFNTSAAENIRLGNPDATHAQVEEAARAAQAHTFITALEDGYDTRLGERGTRLSGGQAQRIALARAFLRDAPLVILDEATANLDARTEAGVTEAVTRLREGRTMLIIAHRLNTIIHADRILVMGEGRIAQQGTHTLLAGQPGPYRTLLQAYEGVHHDYA